MEETRRKERARALRSRQSDVERRLWRRLRNRGLCGAKFRRQHPIGPFFTDFCCTELGVIVELDGGQHALSAEADAARTEYLNGLGYNMLRFWNNELFENLDGVLSRIATAIDSRHGHAFDHSVPLSPHAGRGLG